MIQCDRQELKKALDIISNIVPSKSINDVAGSILVKTYDSDKISLSATSLITHIDVLLSNSTATTDVSFLTAFKLFNDIINSLNTDKISIYEDDKTIKIIADSTEYTITKMDASQFPQQPQAQFDNKITFDAETIKDAIAKTAPFVDKTNIRPTLSGICLDVKEDVIKFVATDANRLAVYSVDYKGLSPQNIIVPAKALQVLQNIDDSEVTIGLADSKAYITTPSITLTTSLIDGKYPNYERVIPTEPITTITLAKYDLEQAIRHLLPVTEPNLRAIKLDIQNDKVLLSARSNKAVAYEDLKLIQKTGEDLTVVVDANYIRDGLRTTNCYSVTLQLTGTTNPVAMTFQDNSNFVYVFMPMEEE